ncbi:MAG: hypothetical protein U0792_02220 [Gemmataceae bacterium]
MKRLAACLLLAGFTQIPLWAGEYFMPPRPLMSSTPQSMQSSDSGPLSTLKRLFSSDPKPETATPAPPKSSSTKTTKKTTAASPATPTVTTIRPASGTVVQPVAGTTVVVDSPLAPTKTGGYFTSVKELFAPEPEPRVVMMTAPAPVTPPPMPRVEKAVAVRPVSYPASSDGGYMIPPTAIPRVEKPVAKTVVAQPTSYPSTTDGGYVIPSTAIPRVEKPVAKAVVRPTIYPATSEGVYMIPPPSGSITLTEQPPTPTKATGYVSAMKENFSSDPEPRVVTLGTQPAAPQAPIQRVEKTTVVGPAMYSATTTEGYVISQPTLSEKYTRVETPRPTSKLTSYLSAPKRWFSSNDEIVLAPVAGGMYSSTGKSAQLSRPRSLAELDAAYPVWSGNPVMGSMSNPAPGTAVTVPSAPSRPVLSKIQGMFGKSDSAFAAAPGNYGVLSTLPSVPPPVPTPVRHAQATDEGVPVIPHTRLVSPVRPAEFVPTNLPQSGPTGMLPGTLYTPPHASGSGIPLPTGFKLIGSEQPLEMSSSPYAGASYSPAAGSTCGSNCGPRCSRSGGLFSGRLMEWAFFQPTTRDALPLLQPLQYVGPVLAFRCEGYGCGAGGYSLGCNSGCASTGAGPRVGNGLGIGGNCGGGGLANRGCRNGCVPPADDAISGYHFGGKPTIEGGTYQQYGSVTSYKPPTTGVVPTAATTSTGSGKYFKPVYATESNVMPARGDVLTRPLTRP